MAGRSGYGNSGNYDSGRRDGGRKQLPSKPPFTAFVGNLPNGITEGDIADHVFQNLSVARTRLVFDHDSSKFKGFCYVEFDDLESMEKALELDGRIHIDDSGVPIRIDVAEGKRNNRDGRGGGSGGGGGGGGGFNRNQRGPRDGRDGGGGFRRQGGGGGGFDNFHNSGFNDRGPGGSGGYGRNQQRSNYGNDFRGGSSSRSNYGFDEGEGGSSGGDWGRNGNRSNYGGGRPARQDGGYSRQNSYSSSTDLPSASADTSNRPRIKLQPRTVTAPINDLADTLQRSSIFGNAKPRDEKVAETKQKQHEEVPQP